MAANLKRAAILGTLAAQWAKDGSPAEAGRYATLAAHEVGTELSFRETVTLILEREVDLQQPSERIRTMRSSGLPHYRLPRSMASEPMACCYVRQPCKVHAQYCGGCGVMMLNAEAPCLHCHWQRSS